MRSFSSLGFILKKKIIGNQDNLLTIYTLTHGKLTAIVKGSQKITSRFLNHFELLNLNQAIFYQSSKSFILINNQIIDRWPEKNFSLSILKNLSILAELIDKTTAIGQKEPDVFFLLKNTLYYLKQSPEQSKLIITIFKIRLLKILGYWPDLNHFTLKKATSLSSYLLREQLGKEILSEHI